MTITLFISLLTVLSMAVSLVTEGCKKLLNSLSVSYATNMVVLIVSAIVGAVGTSAAYIILGIAFTGANVVCIILMAIAVWLCAMLGYDKVVQLIEQMGKLG